jgi:hypothetical protein
MSSVRRSRQGCRSSSVDPRCKQCSPSWKISMAHGQPPIWLRFEINRVLEALSEGHRLRPETSSLTGFKYLVPYIFRVAISNNRILMTPEAGRWSSHTRNRRLIRSGSVALTIPRKQNAFNSALTHIPAARLLDATPNNRGAKEIDNLTISFAFFVLHLSKRRLTGWRNRAAHIVLLQNSLARLRFTPLLDQVWTYCEV